MGKYEDVLLEPKDCVLAIIDEQPQMFFGVEDKKRMEIENAVVGLAKAAKLFGVPTVLSTVAAQSFSGFIYSKIQEVFPEQTSIDRTSLNAFEDEAFRTAVKNTKRKKLILAGLWTEVCVAFPALCAIKDGYEVYIVSDACGGSSKEAHDMAVYRMRANGCQFLTWQALMLEWQRDWANKQTYNAVMDIVKEHGAAYGLGVEYAKTMVPQAQQQQ
jgi:nicotinamidase-related amidase